ncbi:DEAD/DEAH box helicase family protein [Streptococcus equi]|uniref:DEAD/DEAH box helicase family protein n=1 Tax=Streptococcus equi TaxID=1336 RepID=UPI0005B7FA1F|nr:DEAD/DEAH box helicase family protein [Streptococcus equi]KIS06512.1 SNF2 family protein [Streptococcus equi subsp. zooepidemicus Sz5]MCD3391478.1 DEAD/DEAH box helicase family protein [Streptococcus equi subsp. zooepidemicus]MCD3393410.1 DEAD/DEAH box helicase family protein [Streptococcus equi subsp. zooepidemicus]MCD3408114.1 DEAD/DEAH box helicase family protein [Streptococcus equi subsp. zooepidemicus]UFR17411.1 DEAD/DEAH box helicase family protein [Streptococcus equi subsp. zooepidem
MNTQSISHRLRQHQHQDLAIKEAFLRFQAHHFDKPWERLLETFIEQEGRVNLFPTPYDVSEELVAFLSQGDQPFEHLGAYAYHFAQAGLRQIPQLTPFEKDMVVLVATYNLAVYCQLLDQQGSYHGVSLRRLVSQMEQVDFINVSKVANNLADRISRDLDLFILNYEAPTIPKPELTFETTDQDLVAHYGQSVAKLDKASLLVEHLPAYQDLPLGIKADIITHFDLKRAEMIQVKQEETIIFEEVDDVVTAYLTTQVEPLSSYNRRLGKSRHYEAYDQLNVTQKFAILSHYDELAKLERPLQFRLGDFDEERRQTPIYEGETIFTYLEADGSADELAREPGSQELAELVDLSRQLLARHYQALEEAGVPVEDFPESSRGVLLDAVGKYRLPRKELLYLGKYPHAPVYQLRLAVELLDQGLDRDSVTFFLESSLPYERLVFVANRMTKDGLKLEEAKIFGRMAQAEPDKASRLLLEELQAREPETPFDDSLSELKEEVRRIYPLGSLASYGEHLFEVADIREDQGQIRVVLAALPDDDVLDSPVFYVGSLGALEKSQLVYRPETASSLSVAAERDKTGTSDELDLFSFLDDDIAPRSVQVIPDQSVFLDEIAPTEEKSESSSEKDTEEVVEEPILSYPVQDFVFPEDLTDFYPKGTRAKVEANLAAIRLVKELDKSGRQASPPEQEILAKYVGWGGLANSFFDDYNPQFEIERAELKSLVSDKEYSDMKQSSLTAYYTDPAIVRAMWDKLVADGFTGGRVLDPSMGTGNFFATMPAQLRDSCELYGVELDGITGAIAKQLHPNATIFVQGFEDVPFQADSFDLVISNIPFGNFRIADNRYDKPYMIHDYFIKKSLDLVHDAGQVVVISSTGTMDKRVDNVLQDIKDTTQFLGGVRLPDSAFKAIAGTSVTTDMLFFQKDLDKSVTGETIAFSGSKRYAKDDRIWLNPYFDGEDNPQVLGTYEVKNFNGGTLSLKGNGQPLVHELTQALNQVSPPQTKENVFIQPQVLMAQTVDKTIPQAIWDSLELYSFGYEGDTVYYRDRDGIRVGAKTEEISYYVTETGDFVAWDAKHSQAAIERFVALNMTDETAVDVYLSKEATKTGRHKGLFKKTVFYEGTLSDKEVARIKGMVNLRNTYQEMIDLQRDYDYDRDRFEGLLGDLNYQYDRFVKRYGYLNSNVNRNLFDSDDKYSLLASLEDEYIDPVDKKVKYKKSLAFEKALVRPDRILKAVNTAQDALNASLADGRGVDIAFMMSLYPGKTEGDVIEELGDLVLLDPAYALLGKVVYVSRQDFLSGDILTKLDQVDLLQKEDNALADWGYYQSLLEAVKPRQIGLADIAYRIGSRWIPKEVYGQFAYTVLLEEERPLDDPILADVIEVSPIDGTYTLSKDFTNRRVSAQEAAMGVRGSRYDSGRKVFENLLNSNQPTITQTVKEGDKQKQVTDAERTSLLRSREADMQGLFQDFVLSSPEVQTLIADTYNSLYNRTVSKTYDGSHLVIDGLAQNITLRPHQKNAIQRIVEEKRALLAHEVGSGKTLTMLGAGFKLKELGVVNKPLYVVPSSLTAQFGQEILKFFPTKKVFVTTKKDFVKSRRKQFVSRIITGDYDAIVIGDSQFEKIPMSKAKQEAYILDKLSQMREIYLNSENDYTVKESERAIRSLEERLEELQKLDRDSFIEFENLGIDCLFVDEAHHFKNIRPITGLGNVAGITNITAKKNVDMEMKVRQVQSEHDNRHVIFATGTPVSNSISELYTMMNYVQPDVLERYQVAHFDSWVGAFGQIENSMELSPTGDKYQPKKRFKKFVNLPELMRIYKETADIQTSDMLDLPVPEARIIPVESELTDSQRYYLEELVARSEDIKNGLVEPTVDNMLKITGEARKLAIDMRLIDPAYKLSDSQKLLQVVDNVERIYRDNMVTESTQMIFSDIGTPKKDGTVFDIYNELKNLLVERGIPANQIAFVHDANTDDKKNSLSRQVNSGEVRILMASTEKGGTGLNVQAKMKAVHHLDVPWRPSDIQQRNGRLIRQGNQHQHVEIYHYITKGSFDNYLWATQENKLRYIKQIMTSKEPVRAAEDIDEQTMTASDFKALATGNPFLKFKMELENELGLLDNERRAFERTKDDYRQTIRVAERDLPVMEKRLSLYDQDIERSKNSKGKDFVMSFGSQTYTEKGEAGEYLHQLIRQNRSETKELRTLAHYRGFALKVTTRSLSEPIPELITLRVVGDNQYSVSLDLKSPIGTLQRINNVIDDIEKDKETTEALAKTMRDKAAVAKEQVDKTFSKEEHYQNLKVQYDVLAPLIEAGEATEVIEDALAPFLNPPNQQEIVLDDQLSLDI